MVWRRERGKPPAERGEGGGSEPELAMNNVGCGIVRDQVEMLQGWDTFNWKVTIVLCHRVVLQP